MCFKEEEKIGGKKLGRLTSIIKCKHTHMAKKLYIGGLSYNTTQDGLQEAFAQCGTVTSATIITDKMSGRSKGFGFVEMSSDEEANSAIEMWNGKELDGRTLTVNEARPLEDRPRTGGGFSRGGGFGGRSAGGRDSDRGPRQNRW